MKNIWLLILVLSLSAPLFSEITYRQIDSLSVGFSVDLDTNSTPVNTGYFYSNNPYLDGPNYNPDFNCDLTLSGMGLTWCNCDGINRLSYFKTYHTNLSINTLLKSELDLMDTAVFKEINTQINDGLYQMNDTGNYIIKTNKNNYCLVQFDSTLVKLFAICGQAETDYHNCTYAFKTKIWYQDDGTTNFKYNATVKKPVSKRNASLRSSNSCKAYDINGRIVPYKNGRPNTGAGIIIIGNTAILNVK